MKVGPALRPVLTFSGRCFFRQQADRCVEAWLIAAVRSPPAHDFFRLTPREGRQSHKLIVQVRLFARAVILCSSGQQFMSRHHEIRDPKLQVLFLLWITCAFSTFCTASKKPSKQAIRWQEGAPECALIKTPDGFYHYILGYETLSINLAIDNQELEKTRRTAEHVFGVIVTLKNRGSLPIQVGPDYMSLELTQHFKVRLSPIDPSTFSSRIQDESDELVHQSERQLKKHPEKKQEVEDRLKEHEKFVTEWLQFVSTQSLRNVTLDSGQPEVTGWVFFNTKTKWKGGWKEQEDFVLRIPTEKVVFEFPFTLPPAGQAPELRQRSDE